MSPTIDRRRLLIGAGGVAVVAAGGATFAALREDASGDTNGRPAAAGRAGVELPKYRAYTGAKPDLPGTEEGVAPAYLKYPAERPRSVEDTPGDGGRVTAMANISYAPPPQAPKNQYWADLNKRLGTDLRIRMVPSSDYQSVFVTTIAGDDLPDLVMLPRNPGTVPNLPQVLRSNFTDLNAKLGGDAVLKYPNLANMPAEAWRSTVYGGAIYGIPIPRLPIGNYDYIRKDLFDKAGVPVDLKGYDELLEGAKALTDPKERRWAFGTSWGLRALLDRVNGVPNGWRNDGGKLTRHYETEEFKQTVSDMIEMWAGGEGVLHPDAFSATQPYTQLFTAGTYAIMPGDGYVGITQYLEQGAADPGFELGLMPSYTREGDKLAKWNEGSGAYSFCGISKQKDPKRLDMLLRLLNWIAAPFGTDEYTFRVYGKEGRDHTLDKNGNPILTKEGSANTVVPTRYLGEAPSVLFVADDPRYARMQHEYQSKLVPRLEKNPAVGLYSKNHAEKSANIERAFGAGMNDIVVGRKPLSSLDELIKTWGTSGGNAIRAELEEQLQKNGGTAA